MCSYVRFVRHFLKNFILRTEVHARRAEDRIGEAHEIARAIDVASAHACRAEHCGCS